jgi:hypothetical protein
VCSFGSRFLPGKRKSAPDPAAKEKGTATATATAAATATAQIMWLWCDLALVATKRSGGESRPRERVATTKLVQAAVFTGLFIVRIRLEEPQHEL